MAVMKTYNQFLDSLWTGLIDTNTANLKAMLVSSTYVPNFQTHKFRSDVTGEITGTNYDEGGKVINFTPELIDTEFVIQAENVVWESLTASGFRYIVIYDASQLVESNMPLICCFDLEEAQSVTSTNYELVWGSSGIINTKIVA